MKRLFRSLLTIPKKIYNQKWVVYFVFVALVLLLIYFFPKINFNHQVTGFGEFSKNEFYRPAKTLWDWLELLIIPVVLVLGGYFLNRSGKRQELKLAEERRKMDIYIAEQRNQEIALREYFDRMSTLLLDYDLKESKDYSVHRSVAIARTHSILRRIDGEKKGIIIKFIYDSGLIFNECTIIDLKRADLTNTDLRTKTRYKIDLGGANFRDVNLENANLEDTMLIGANFELSNLRNTNFKNSNLKDANLNNTKLHGANFINTLLEDTSFEHATLKDINIKGFINLDGANLKGVTWENANLIYGSLRGVNFERAKLPYANFSGAKLEGANLKKADLNSACLEDAKMELVTNLTQKQIDAAYYFHSPPLLPEGFNPPPKKDRSLIEKHNT